MHFVKFIHFTKGKFSFYTNSHIRLLVINNIINYLSIQKGMCIYIFTCIVYTVLFLLL